ncbi:MAG: transcription elongation factor GreA [Armatimonadota bacterium]|nr:transcription elongation factor GreA [Armatimonadota bacterium]
MPKDILLTAEGYRRLEEELTRLTTIVRQEVRDRVRDTKPTSDEGEDAAYDSAKQEQAFVEGRIQELREVFTRARVLTDEEIRTDEVQLGSRVRVTNLNSGSEMWIRLVSPLEASPERGYISTESPVGVALLGRKPGETVDVRAPAGVIRYRIEEIRRE